MRQRPGEAQRAGHGAARAARGPPADALCAGHRSGVPAARAGRAASLDGEAGGALLDPRPLPSTRSRRGRRGAAAARGGWPNADDENGQPAAPTVRPRRRRHCFPQDGPRHNGPSRQRRPQLAWRTVRRPKRQPARPGPAGSGAFANSVGSAANRRTRWEGTDSPRLDSVAAEQRGEIPACSTCGVYDALPRLWPPASGQRGDGRFAPGPARGNGRESSGTRLRAVIVHGWC